MVTNPRPTPTLTSCIILPTMMRLFNTLLVAAAAFLGAFTAISRHHPPEPAPQPSTVVQYVTDPTVCRIALRTQEAKR